MATGSYWESYDFAGNAGRQDFFIHPLGPTHAFDGLGKTGERIALGDDPGELDASARADVAASFQAAVVDTLVEKCVRACDATGLERLVVAGGVGANQRLRSQLQARGAEKGFGVYYPKPALCTDNGAMIAFAGWHRRGQALESPTIVARPRWRLDELAPLN